MEKVIAFLHRYTQGFFSIVKAYCDWAESQASNQTDLLVLGIGPFFLLGLALWLLPEWLGKAMALTLLLPCLYVVCMVLRAYAQRGVKR